MKFIILDYAKNNDDIEVKGFLKKLPKRLLDFYITKTIPYTFYEKDMLNTQGYKVKLPITKDEGRDNPKRLQKVLGFVLDEFMKKDVNVAIAPDDMELPDGLYQSGGHVIFAFLISEAVEKTLSNIGKELGRAHIVIIDGENMITDLVLDSLYESANYLSIYTNRPVYFTESQEYIYKDCGLHIETFTSAKNELLMEADVIINADAGIENLDYYFKEGSIYLDVAKNRKNLVRLINKREDMVFIDALEIGVGENTYCDKFIEMSKYINNKTFRRFINDEYDFDRQKELFKNMRKEKYIIEGFHCFDKPIKR